MRPISSIRRCESGATAVEFAFILPLLLFFVFGSIEQAIVLFIRSTIESAVAETARYGAITGEGDGRKEQLLRIVEERTYGLLDPDRIKLETLIYDDFDDIGRPEPFTDTNRNGSYDRGERFSDVNGNGKWDPDMGKAGLGGENAIVVYRLSYPWGLITPMLRGITAGSILNQSSIVVKNEPFGSASSTGTAGK